MSSCLSLDLNLPTDHVIPARLLFVALIGPNEKGRHAVASALKNSPNADVFEFDSYPPDRGYIRAVLENPFNVLILELDSNVELALELIREASKFRGVAVLAYSARQDSKLTFKALQAGALAYSISKDATELRRQVDKLAAAYSPAEEESTTANESRSTDLENTDEGLLQMPSPPAILPEDFDGWDDHIQIASDASRANEPEAKQILSPTPIEPAVSGTIPVSSLVHPKRNEEEDSRQMKQLPAHNDQPFWPQTFNDAEETRLHEDLGSPTERLLKISTSKLWSGILFSGEKQRIPKFDSAQLRDADHEIEEMFRRSAAKTFKGKTLKRGGKIAASISLASAFVLTASLLIWSHPQPLVTVGQTVLRAPVSAIMRTASLR